MSLFLLQLSCIVRSSMRRMTIGVISTTHHSWRGQTLYNTV